jgi:hypothetical protein
MCPFWYLGHTPELKVQLGTLHRSLLGFIMARKKSFRLTMKKKQKEQGRGGDPDAPTPKEWETMKKYGSFGSKSIRELLQ